MPRSYKRRLGALSRRSYDPENLGQAVAAVRSGRLSYRKASSKFNDAIPSTDENSRAEEAVLEVEAFVLLDYPYMIEREQRNRQFVGIAKEVGAKEVEVRFLRPYQGRKSVFIFPDIPDDDTVDKGQIRTCAREPRSSMDKPELFSRDGAPYRAVADAQLGELWPLLSWPQQPLPVLDVGCGPGDVTSKVLAPRLPHGTKLVACDISPEMVEFGRRHNSLSGAITYELFDAMDPDLEKSAVWRHVPFGKVFAVMLMHWIPDNRRAIQNMHKLLVPGGEAVFTILAKSAFFAAYEELAKDHRWAQYMKDVEKVISPYQHSEDPVGEFSQLLQSEGFQVLRCDVSPRSFVFPSEAQHRDALKSVNAFLNRIPEDQKDDFVDDWMQHMEKMDGLTKDTGSTGEMKFCMHYMSMVAVSRKL